jgi:hypothetical protein
MQAAAPAISPITQTSPDNAKAVETLREVQAHLQRYRELSSQGKWAEAGKELEQIQQLVNK